MIVDTSLADVVQCDQCYACRAAGALQFVGCDMSQVCDSCAQVHRATAPTGVEHRDQLHLGTESESSYRFRPVNLQGFNIAPGDQPDQLLNARPDSADVAVELGAHVDAPHDALQIAAGAQARQRPANGCGGAQIR
ncbi:hypothetical protein D3C85_1283870 [compost metagenome]